jgi:adenosylmethionine-8-amino-7-oxononanoate aminotransferase
MLLIAIQRGQREQQRQSQPMQRSCQAQRDRHQHVGEVRGRADVTAIEAICRPTSHRGQHQQRHELHQPEQAELERGMIARHVVRSPRDVVSLPADHHHHRRRGEHGGKPRRPEQPIGGNGQGAGRSGWG